MNFNIVKKAKIFLIIALVILVAGMAMLGIFGMNKSIDDKAHFEMQISIDQTADDAVTLMHNSVETYFGKSEIKPVKYSVQKLNDGATLIYKFNDNVVESVSALKTAIESDLLAKSINAGVTVEAQEVYSYAPTQIGWLLLALGIAIAASFIYLLIMEKLASAVATIFSAVLSIMLFIAIVSITRIPVGTALPFCAIASIILSVGLSIATVNKYKEEMASSENKINASEVANKVAFSEIIRYAIVLGVVIVSAILLGVLCRVYVGFTAIQIAVAGIVAVVSTYFATPAIWSILKNK